MNEESSSTQPAPEDPSSDGRREKSLIKQLADWLGGRNGETARDALEELIEEPEDGEASLGDSERQLLGNILELHERTIADVMVPRADIVAVKAATDLDGLVDLISEENHSRMPVYRETLDDAFGMVHVKDVLAWRGDEGAFSAANIVRPVLFVAPSMQVLELLLEMRAKRVHMALVVDEYGGVDGLATIEDLVEEIVGEIEDEFDEDEKPSLVRQDDGSWIAGARTPLEDLEGALSQTIFSEVEHDEVDTLGGLAFTIAGHVPTRGELLTHEASGLEFEVLDADPRHIKRLRIRTAEDVAPESTGPGGDAALSDVDWAEQLLSQSGAGDDADTHGHDAPDVDAADMPEKPAETRTDARARARRG